MSGEKKPKLGTWGAVTRSTEEEHQKFKKFLDQLYINPDKGFLNELVRIQSLIREELKNNG
jgi:hypothetical protein